MDGEKRYQPYIGTGKNPVSDSGIKPEPIPEKPKFFRWHRKKIRFRSWFWWVFGNLMFFVKINVFNVWRVKINVLFLFFESKYIYIGYKVRLKLYVIKNKVEQSYTI